MKDEFAIQTNSLSRSFGAVQAVESVNLAISSGEIYGFLGPNGAGKSSVVRMLTTLLLPTSGSAMVAGHDVVSEPTAVRLKIGAALQEAALDEKQTGRELLELQSRLYGLGGPVINQRIELLAGLLNIEESLDRLTGTYSGGMKRKLDLAIAMIHEPQILFLDEPTTGLDPISRVELWDEARQVNEEKGVTIFMTTQYLEEADYLAGRVGIINQGRIVAEGTPAELKRSVGSDIIVVRTDGQTSGAAAACGQAPGVESVEVHGNEITLSVDQGSKAIGPVAIALDQSGALVEDIVLRTATLDDVFLHYTGARLEVVANIAKEEIT